MFYILMRSLELDLQKKLLVNAVPRKGDIVRLDSKIMIDDLTVDSVVYETSSNDEEVEICIDVLSDCKVTESNRQELVNELKKDGWKDMYQ